MDLLVDTNVLLRSADPAHPMHRAAVAAVNAIRLRGDRPCIASQNLLEFRTVCTRSRDGNGLGMDQTQANAEVGRVRALFHVLPEDPRILEEWERLVNTYGAAGKQNHDARIVAAMVVHSISSILTLDKADFARYEGIAVLTPRDALPAA